MWTEYALIFVGRASCWVQGRWSLRRGSYPLIRLGITRTDRRGRVRYIDLVTVGLLGLFLL